MILLFYNLALLAAMVVGAPWWLWKMATTHKYRVGLAERLGRVRPNLIRPDLTRGNKPILWLHAVSVGEVLAVSRLVGELDQAFPNYRLLISTTTRTGQDLAIQKFGADRVFYCPLDLPWAVRTYMKTLQPKMLILAETEFWPNLLSACFHRNIPVAVVNARISDRSWPRYRALKILWRPFLSRIACVMAQTETDSERLKAIGCAPDRVSVSGNLKFDVRAAQQADATRLLKSLTTGLRMVVAGSTLEGEEAALLEAWPQILAADPNLAMVLAPRHPERFTSVASLLEQSGISWIKRFDWRSQPEASIQPIRSGQIVLLDTIGELASVYSLAAVAFVGGSLIPAGGHNPLEPAQFAVPIVMGPNYANFRAITEDLLTHNALRIATKEDLASTLITLLKDSSNAKAMGERAMQVFIQQAGATDRSVKALRRLVLPPWLQPSRPEPRNPALFWEARKLKNDGVDIENVLKFLRENHCDQIDSITIVMTVYDLSHNKAKEIVHTGNAWKDRLVSDNLFHDQLWQELEKIAESDESGVTRSESGSVIPRSEDPKEE